MKKTLITLLALASVAVAGDLSFGMSTNTDASWSDGVDFTYVLESPITLTYTGTTGYVSDSRAIYVEDQFTATGVEFYSPKVQQYVNTSGTYWEMGFTMASSESISIDSMTIELEGRTGSGENWTNDFYNLGQVKITLCDAEKKELGTATVTIGSKGASVSGVITFEDGIELNGTPTQYYLKALDASADAQGFVAMKGGSIAYSAIPEPTTSTLSLLALAGLAARRRRK